MSGGSSTLSFFLGVAALLATSAADLTDLGLDEVAPISSAESGIGIEVNRQTGSDEAEFRLDEDSGDFIAETGRNNLRSLARRKVDEDNLEAVDPKEAKPRRGERSLESRLGSEGNVPTHMTVHADSPEGRPRAYNLSKRHVFGKDSRKVFRDTAYPYSTVGRVSGGCTGTMIGPRHVLTAAHCLSAGSMTFTPSYYDGDAPYGTARVAKKLHWDLVQTSDGFYDNEVAYDYAVLVLDRRLGDSTGWMGTKVFSENWKDGKYWSNIGYPQGLTRTRRPVFTKGGAVWHTKEYARRSVRGTLLGHFIDIEGGHSGGPLYAYFGDEGYPSVVGVQSTESFDPSRSTGGDNQAGGGRGMVDLAEYALGRYP